VPPSWVAYERGVLKGPFMVNPSSHACACFMNLSMIMIG